MKGFSQKEGIDYHEMFSLVVRHKTIQALLDMMSVLDLELEKFNVKIVFLHGNLEDNTYMS